MTILGFKIATTLEIFKLYLAKNFLLRMQILPSPACGASGGGIQGGGLPLKILKNFKKLRCKPSPPTLSRRAGEGDLCIFRLNFFRSGRPPSYFPLKETYAGEEISFCGRGSKELDPKWPSKILFRLLYGRNF